MNFLGPGAAARPQATHKLQVRPVRLPLQPQPWDLPQLLMFGAAGCQKTSRLLIGFLSEVNQIKIKYQVNQGKKAQIKLTVKINTIRQLSKENLMLR